MPATVSHDFTRTVLVGLAGVDTPGEVLEDHFDELERLVETAGGVVVARVRQDRTSADPATWIGKGKVEELAACVGDLDAGLVVAEGELTPVQLRNMQDKVGVRVVDRADLILDIFARYARTREARIAVELALLEQQLPRLAGQWFGLSRQGGGIGTRGLGEKRLELDRRAARGRIARLKKDLERIETSREVQRSGRSEIPVVALAGYTNAGKSTLFTMLTREEVFAADRLFATLDSRHARLPLPGGVPAVLVDTVGFIRKLPHRLVASFRSTLSEVHEAALVLHVVDASHPAAAEQQKVAEETLEEMGVDAGRVLLVSNKIDRLPPASRRGLGGVAISAVTGEGIDRLKDEIARRLARERVSVELELEPGDGATLAEIRRSGEILEVVTAGDDEHPLLRVKARVWPALAGKLARRDDVRLVEGES